MKLAAIRFCRSVTQSVSVALVIHGAACSIAQEPGVFQGHNGAVMMAAFASDNNRVVTASADETAKLWNASTGAELSSWGQHTGPLYCLSVSADGRTLVTGAQDNTLRIWDVPLSRPLRRLLNGGQAVQGLALSSDGKVLLASSSDKAVRIFDLATPFSPSAAAPDPILRHGHATESLAVAFRNDGGCFASSDSDGRILLWSPDLDAPIGRLMSHSGKVGSLTFPSSNQQLLSAGDDGAVRVWQLMPSPPGALASTDSAGLTLSVVAGQSLAVFATSNGMCRLINTQSGDVVREFPSAGSTLSDVALSPNNAWLLLSTRDGQTRQMDFNNGTLIGTVGGHDGPITDVAVHPDAQRFATSGKDGTVRLWKSPVPAVSMPGHAAPVRNIASSTNGQWTATISDDMTTRLWNSSGGAMLQLGNHTQPVRAVSIRDDDSLLATGDAEGTVWLWNPANGSAEGVVSAHAAAITALTFSADRNSLVTSAADGSIRSWPLPLPKQKPSAVEEPPKPTWEFKLPDNSAVTQLARVSKDHGLVALTATGSSILRLNWDGSSGAAIDSPGGALRQLDVASTGDSFLAASVDGQVHVFAADGALQKSFSAFAGLTSARFDRDAKLITLCDAKPRVRILDAASGRIQEEITTSLPVVDADWTAADQRSIVAIGSGNELLLHQRSLLRLWDGFTGGATSVAFTPDQQQLLTAAADGAIRSWNLSDGNPVRTYEGLTSSIAELTVSPNGALICAAAENGTLGVWNVADGHQKYSFSHSAPLRSVAVSADSTRVATASSDGIVRVWDLTNGQLLESFSEHAAGTAIHSVRYVNDSQTLISSGEDKTLHMMKTSAVRSWPVHTGAIRSLASYNGGAQVVTAGDDGRVIMTNMASGNPDRVFITTNQTPTSVAARIDNQRIAAGCESGEVLIWNANNGEQILQTLNVGATVNALAWSPDNRKLAVSTVANTVHVFGPTVPNVQPAKELVMHQTLSTDGSVTRLLFSPDSRSIWTSLANGNIDEWSYAGPEQRRQFNHGGPVYGVAVSRDGSTVVSCSTDQTVRVWDATTGQQKFQLNGHTGSVHAVAMSPDETFAVSSGADGTLRLWDIVGGRQLKQLVTFDSTMYSVSIHPNGALIAAAGADRKVHLLDMISGIERQQLTGHTDYVHCVAFSPDGQQLLSYGYAGQLKLWNSADGNLLHEARLGRVGNYAQFAPDGRRVIVANGDGTARIQALP